LSDQIVELRNNSTNNKVGANSTVSADLLRQIQENFEFKFEEDFEETEFQLNSACNKAQLRLNSLQNKFNQLYAVVQESNQSNSHLQLFNTKLQEQIGNLNIKLNTINQQFEQSAQQNNELEKLRTV